MIEPEAPRRYDTETLTTAKLFVPEEFAIAAGTVQMFRSQVVPEYWHVSFRPLVDLDCEVFLGADAAGIGFRVGTGAKLTLPGISRELSIANYGAVLVRGVVVACRGYKVDIELGG